MSRTRIVVLMVVVLALVAIGHHQLAQFSNNVLNTSFVPEAQATSTPTPTPTPTATPTPTPTPTPEEINQSCTPGFYKNHTQYITGCDVTNGVSTTLAQLNLSGLANCNNGGNIFPMGNLTVFQALSVPASYCGPGTLAQQELNLLRQAITAYLNAANSNPQACSAASSIVNAVNAAVAQANVGNTTALSSLQNSLSTNINNDKFGTLCGSRS